MMNGACRIFPSCMSFVYSAILSKTRNCCAKNLPDCSMGREQEENRVCSGKELLRAAAGSRVVQGALTWPECCAGKKALAVPAARFTCLNE